MPTNMGITKSLQRHEWKIGVDVKVETKCGFPLVKAWNKKFGRLLAKAIGRRLFLIVFSRTWDAEGKSNSEGAGKIIRRFRFTLDVQKSTLQITGRGRRWQLGLLERSRVSSKGGAKNWP